MNDAVNPEALESFGFQVIAQEAGKTALMHLKTGSVGWWYNTDEGLREICRLANAKAEHAAA